MTYTQTALRYVSASYGLPTPGHARDAAAKLPMSDACELIRDQLDPATSARYHAGHVENVAAELRAALVDVTEDTISSGYEIADRLAYAARALLAAIGEGESA